MYSEPYQTSTMGLFAKIVHEFSSVIFAKRSILDVWQGSKYASVDSNKTNNYTIVLNLNCID